MCVGGGEAASKSHSSLADDKMPRDLLIPQMQALIKLLENKIICSIYLRTKSSDFIYVIVSCQVPIASRGDQGRGTEAVYRNKLQIL